MNQLEEKELEKVSGGHTDDKYGHSYTGKESESIPQGTHCIYTEGTDGHMPHRVTYIEYAGWNLIVLRPDDDEARKYFAKSMRNDYSCVIKERDCKDYEVDYTNGSDNHLYKV